MIVFLIGCFIFLIGVFNIRFATMANVLRQSDVSTWNSLGSPYGYSFSDLGKTISLYSWILSKKFVNSESEDIVAEGNRIFPKALLAKRVMLVGLFTMFLGLVITLANAIT